MLQCQKPCSDMMRVLPALPRLMAQRIAVAVQACLPGGRWGAPTQTTMRGWRLPPGRPLSASARSTLAGKRNQALSCCFGGVKSAAGRLGQLGAQGCHVECASTAARLGWAADIDSFHCCSHGPAGCSRGMAWQLAVIPSASACAGIEKDWQSCASLLVSPASSSCTAAVLPPFTADPGSQPDLHAAGVCKEWQTS